LLSVRLTKVADGLGERHPSGGIQDPYLRSKAEVALEPTRVIVEFDRGEFSRLDAVSRGAGASEYLRLLALEAIATQAGARPLVRHRGGSLHERD
jgi:hypothetical protein